MMNGEGFGENLADGHARVERGVRILKDDGQMAAKATEIVGWESEQINGRGIFVRVVQDFAGGWFKEAEKNAREGGFAGAGFADEAESLAAMEREGDIVEDALGTDVFGESGCFDEFIGGWQEADPLSPSVHKPHAGVKGNYSKKGKSKDKSFDAKVAKSNAKFREA